MSFVNLSGYQFGSLTVIKRIEDHIASSGRKYPQYLCLCKCGKECTALAQQLTAGRKTNCGCLTSQMRSIATTARNTKHGDGNRMGKRNRLYQLWSGMKVRCYNKNDPTYQRYGAKGVKICDAWLDYPAFKEWALANGYDYNAPRGKCTIDRIDPNGNYCPENCRFVSVDVQGDNRSNVIHIEYNGETHNLSQWARILCINRTTLLLRYKNGLRGDKLFFAGDYRNHKE